MKVVQPGHIYEVDPLGSGEVQRIVFCRRSSAMVDYGDGEHPGTNTQELLRVIIDLAKVVANDEHNINATRTGFDNIPFSHENIEDLPVGKDGHLLL